MAGLLLCAEAGCSAGPSGVAPGGAPPSNAAATIKEAPLEVADAVARGRQLAGLQRHCHENLAAARERLERIRALDPNRPAELSWDNTIERIDRVHLALQNAVNYPNMLGVVHPDEAMREAARECQSDTDELLTSMYLDVALAERIQAYANKNETLAPERQRFVTRLQQDFMRTGAALPSEKRRRIAEIHRQLTRLGQQFTAQIGAGQGAIEIPPEHLAGLSESFKKSHPVNEYGLVRITTDYPDYSAFTTQARERNAAQELYIKYVNRGGRGNIARLEKMLALRHEKARLLGYAHWADYVTETSMAKSAAGVSEFIQKLTKSVEPAVKIELAALQEQWRRLGHDERVLSPADRLYVVNQLAKRRHGMNRHEVADYFEFERVTQGLFDITRRMYGVEITPAQEAVWHPSVRVYRVSMDGKPIGKFYLDMFPRAFKYQHAALFPITTAKVLAPGVEQLPSAALVCNFSKPNTPMSHLQVVTYFHEFGHVLHYLFARPELASFSGIKTQRDFDEMPSQVFEEWAWDQQVLSLFARHKTNGKPLPDRLFEAMTASRQVGRALLVQNQLYLAALDMAYHTAAPPVDSSAIMRQQHRQRLPFPYLAGTHFQASFDHLVGYDANYYSYQWARALSYEAMQRFRREGLLNPETAAVWRREVLAPGAARDEAAMVRAFIGHAPDVQPYADFLKNAPKAR